MPVRVSPEGIKTVYKHFDTVRYLLHLYVSFARAHWMFFSEITQLLAYITLAECLLA